MLAALMNQAHVAQVMRDYDGDQLQCKILLDGANQQMFKRLCADRAAGKKQEG